jgi:hypothetical protein
MKQRQKTQCKTCGLPPDRLAALHSSIDAGEKPNHAAKRFGLSVAGLHRHLKSHRPEKAGGAIVVPPCAPDVDALAPGPRDDEDELLTKLRRLQTVTDETLEKAVGLASLDLVLKAVREATHLLRLQGELTERLGSARLQVTVDLRLHAGYLEMRRLSAEALAPFPDARAALAAALVGVGGVS